MLSARKQIDDKPIYCWCDQGWKSASQQQLSRNCLKWAYPHLASSSNFSVTKSSLVRRKKPSFLWPILLEQFLLLPSVGTSFYLLWIIFTIPQIQGSQGPLFIGREWEQKSELVFNKKNNLHSAWTEQSAFENIIDTKRLNCAHTVLYSYSSQLYIWCKIVNSLLTLELILWGIKDKLETKQV